MKHKLQTLLKHKLQWLLLLAALLGVSQGVWGYTVYFDNTNTNWSNVYIYFYNSNYWDSNNGSGSQNIASGPNAMTHVSGNIWSYENNGSYTRVAFTKDSQSGYGNFWQTEAAYSDGADFNVTGSLSSSTPLFTPSTTKTTKNSNVPYYSGAWSAYTPPTPYTVYFDNTNTNWSNVYIYFYNSNFWDTNNGSGSQNIASGPNAMTHVSGNIWSYENNGNYTRVAFTKDSQSGYGNFWQTEAAYSDGTNFNVTGSLSSSTPLFTPSTTKTTKNSNVPYYSGAWSEYSSCTTPTISAVTPSSAQTKSLSTNSATPSAVQAVTATYSGGNQKGWTVTPSTISGYTAATFDNAASASTNLNMNYEGEYTATFGAGCGNTSDATRTTAKITVNPSEIYLAGPLLDGSGVWATNHKMTKSGSTFTYEWTAARTSGQFTLRTSTSADQAGYIIPNYAKNNYTGITAANSGNHNLSVSGVSFAVGERVKVTATYVGWNSTEGKPEYNISFTKVCSNPTAQTVSGTATICYGSSTNVTVSSSQSNYTYKLYKDGSATATTQTGSTGSALNFSVSEAGTYTVHAYYTSGSDAYCKADMTGSATVTVDATSVAGTISTGTSNLCKGTTTDITLSGYTGSIQWHVSKSSGFTPSSSTAISGATSATYAAPINEEGNKYYKAVVTSGVCPSATTGQRLVRVRRDYNSSDFTLSDNAQTYDGSAKAVTVTANDGNGEITVKYAGAGSTTYTESTTAPTDAGLYSITIDVTTSSEDSHFCAATNLSLGSDTIKKATQETLTISNTATDLVYCAAANVKLTTSGGSGDGAVTYTVTSGSGDVDGDVLSPSAKGSVSVVADKVASTNYRGIKSVAKTFNFNIDAPEVYELSNVGGATTICGDPSSGAGSGTLRLANSQTGYKYQLYSNGAPIEGYAAKAGTDDSSIDFPITSSGTYTVYAYYGDNSTNCPTLMDGEITLTISTQPRLVRSAAKVSQYVPVTITCISTDIETWEVTNAGSTAYLYNQTYDAIDFKGASTNSPYTITATTKGGCSETTTITVSDDHEECN